MKNEPDVKKTKTLKVRCEINMAVKVLKKCLGVVGIVLLTGTIMGFVYSYRTSFKLYQHHQQTSINNDVLQRTYITASERQSNDIPQHTQDSAQPTQMKFFHNIPFTGRITNYTGDVYFRNESGWYIDKGICSGNANFVRAQLRGPAKTPIFVYSASEDQWVSQNIIRHGMWEGEWVNKLNRLMDQHPDTVFLDIGANVGVFSLTAAKLGRRVIAIEALESNIARLCKSVNVGKLSSNIILIHNALSNKREKVALGTYKKNVGGTFVKKLGISSRSNTFVVDAIYLDDLLELINFKECIIKMDVETFEANVLEGAEQFFKSTIVKYILLEFVSHRGKSSGKFIVDFLHRFNLEPELPSAILTDSSKWPGEVLFKRSA